MERPKLPGPPPCRFIKDGIEPLGWLPLIICTAVVVIIIGGCL